MKFSGSDKKISLEQILDVEKKISLTFPEKLRETYLLANGGEPEPYVFRKNRVEAVVNEFLPLISKNSETAVEVYVELAQKKSLIPLYMMPFAADPGGDYFLVDTRKQNGEVHLYRHDTSAKNPILNLKIGIGEFWGLLEEEE